MLFSDPPAALELYNAVDWAKLPARYENRDSFLISRSLGFQILSKPKARAILSLWQAFTISTKVTMRR